MILHVIHTRTPNVTLGFELISIPIPQQFQDRSEETVAVTVSVRFFQTQQRQQLLESAVGIRVESFEHR
jgi:hypothetical protein